MLAVVRKLADGLIALSAAIGALGLLCEVVILGHLARLFMARKT